MKRKKSMTVIKSNKRSKDDDTLLIMGERQKNQIIKTLWMNYIKMKKKYDELKFLAKTWRENDEELDYSDISYCDTCYYVRCESGHTCEKCQCDNICFGCVKEGHECKKCEKCGTAKKGKWQKCSFCQKEKCCDRCMKKCECESCIANNKNILLCFTGNCQSEHLRIVKGTGICPSCNKNEYLYKSLIQDFKFCYDCRETELFNLN